MACLTSKPTGVWAIFFVARVMMRKFDHKPHLKGASFKPSFVKVDLDERSLYLCFFKSIMEPIRALTYNPAPIGNRPRYVGGILWCLFSPPPASDHPSQRPGNAPQRPCMAQAGTAFTYGLETCHRGPQGGVAPGENYIR
jgi:hypothetical protein